MTSNWTKKKSDMKSTLSDENCWRSSLSKIIESENFAKCTEWPQTKLKESGIKSSLHVCTVVPRVPNFRPFRSTISHFQDLTYFRIFPLTPMLKFHFYFFLFFWQIAKTFTPQLFISYNYLIYHKVWSKSDENGKRSSVLTFLLECGLMLTKTKKIVKSWKVKNLDKEIKRLKIWWMGKI